MGVIRSLSLSLSLSFLFFFLEKSNFLSLLPLLAIYELSAYIKS